MIMQIHYKQLIFLLVKKILEMLLTLIVLHYLPLRDQKTSGGI